MNLLAQGLAFLSVEAWLTNVASHASNMCHLIGTWFDDSDISQHEVVLVSTDPVTWRTISE